MTFEYYTGVCVGGGGGVYAIVLVVMPVLVTAIQILVYFGHIPC